MGECNASRRFLAHAAFLTIRSAFFNKAFSGPWREAHDRTVQLPDDDPETFELYLHHIYTGNLAVLPDGIAEDRTDESERLALAKIYVFAEKVQDPKTKNTVLKAIISGTCIELSTEEYNRCLPPPSVVKVIYDGTAEGSLARKLLGGMYTGVYDVASRADFRDTQWPREFLDELTNQVSLRQFTHAGYKEGWKTGGGQTYMEPEGPLEG
mgnify:CR=1 FL=1